MKQDNIIMNVEDPRYRYFQWLRRWYGFKELNKTHKCPFYQFMAWGSIALIVLFPLLVISHVLYYINYPIISLIPFGFKEKVKKLRKEEKFEFLYSMIGCTFVFGIITILIFAAHPLKVLYYIGLVIFFVFSIPYAILYFVGMAFSYLWKGLVIIFNYIVGFFVGVNYISVFTIFWKGLLCLIFSAIAIWLIYRISLIIFRSKLFKNFITWACEKREQRLERLKQEEKERKKREEKLRLEEMEDPKYIEKERLFKEKLKRRGEIVENVFSIITFPFVLIFDYILGPTFKVIGIIFSKIWAVIVVIFSMTSQFVSNHCPPIDFTRTKTIKGVLYNLESEQMLFDKYFYVNEKEYNVCGQHSKTYSPGILILTKKLCVYVNKELVPGSFERKVSRLRRKEIKVKLDYTICIGDGQNHSKFFSAFSVENIEVVK